MMQRVLQDGADLWMYPNSMRYFPIRICNNGDRKYIEENVGEGREDLTPVIAWNELHTEVADALRDQERSELANLYPFVKSLKHQMWTYCAKGDNPYSNQ